MRIKKVFKNGVWQGSCLASTLFNIYINDITTIDKESINMYADDMMMIINGNDTTEIIIKTNERLKKIVEYCKNNNIELNHNKCKYMPLRGRKKIQ